MSPVLRYSFLLSALLLGTIPPAHAERLDSPADVFALIKASADAPPDVPGAAVGAEDPSFALSAVKPAGGGGIQDAADSGPKFKLVAFSTPTLRAILKKATEKERKASMDKSFEVLPGISLGGAGAFSFLLLDENEVRSDPVKQGALESSQAQGQDLAFVRTNAKIQLFGSVLLPVNIPGASVSPTAGLRLSGLIEIAQTLAIAKDAVQESLKDRVYLWPITVESLKNDLKTGEDVTITGRVESGAGAKLNAGWTLGDFFFGRVGAGGEAGAGKSAEEWISLHIKKLDDENVRIVLRRGNGQVVAETLKAWAGVDLYDDSFIPHAASPQENMIGIVVRRGDVMEIEPLERLVRAELSAVFSHGTRSSRSEGWGALSLSEPSSVYALRRLFSLDPSSLRGLPPRSTFADALDAGHMQVESMEVTREALFQARLSALHMTRAKNTSYYEMKWSKDGLPPEHKLVGVTRSSSHGDVTGFNRELEAAMWYDMARKRYGVSISLGPEIRKFTTTARVIQEVRALQKALGMEISPALPSSTMFKNTVENGHFTLTDKGVRRLGASGPDELVAAYLKADWIFEQALDLSGGKSSSSVQAPPWADADSKASRLEAVLRFLRDNRKGIDEAFDAGRKGYSHERAVFIRRYARLAPGRALGADLHRFHGALRYADAVLEMSKAGDEPEQVLEAFQKARRSLRKDLKRFAAASAILAGPENYSGYIELTGEDLSLRPAKSIPPEPSTPIDELNGVVRDWMR
ncbi:MAG: hypothetical protein WCU88_03860 [Elusimicrobiota bacterium]|jgi:hypothetical protein